MQAMLTTKASTITALHKGQTIAWHISEPEAAGTDILGLIENNHYQNFLLWHEEDIARRDDLGAERIRRCKRTIDSHNQQRNNFIEKIDQRLVEILQPPTEGIPFNSETPGMIIDRLSILSLKEFHMAEEVERPDDTEEHRRSCRLKLSIIRRQLSDLALAFDELLSDITSGSRSFRVHFQFKMHNELPLNPQLRESFQKIS